MWERDDKGMEIALANFIMKVRQTVIQF